MKTDKKVCDIARFVRSKNAGPFWVTIDIFCDDDASYELIKNSPNLKLENVAALYNTVPDKMKIFYLDSLRAIKYSFERPHPSGWKYENDMHSGQQYIALSQIVL